MENRVAVLRLLLVSRPTLRCLSDLSQKRRTMKLTTIIVALLCVAPLTAQAPDTPAIPELDVRPPELLPPFHDTVSARQRIFEELDGMNGQELLRIHQTISLINRFPAADDFLSDPPQLPLIRSELESFVAAGDDLRIARLYELFKLQREHQRQKFLDLLGPEPTDPKV